MSREVLRAYVYTMSGDMETPVTIFQKYVGNEKGFLLESSEIPRGRYSFIGKSPFVEIKAKNNMAVIESRGKIEISGGRALDVVKEHLERYEVFNDTGIPFIGGAAGSIGYDIIRQYEEIPADNPDTLGLPELHLMFVKELIVYDHKYQQIKIVILETDDKKGKFAAQKKSTGIEHRLTQQVPSSGSKIEIRTRNPGIFSNTTKTGFMEGVRRIKEYIKNGDIFQCVLSLRLTIKSKDNPFSLYRRLRQINPSAYLFYFNFGDYQVTGSSPEMLVEVFNDRITNCPIAGTIKRGKTPKEDSMLAEKLINDPKERAEHSMLVDLGRNDMGKVAEIGSVKVTNLMEIRKYSHVMHLVSTVEGKKRCDKDIYEILMSFLPAGTLTGAPKIRAMEIIEEIEPDRRCIYGGAMGYIGFDGSLDTCIAIRTMVINDGMVHLQAGAGIVADSDPEKEYEETNNKLRALLKIFSKEN
ncbi:MAG: anthranilate synthase component I [Clostridia bacterium]|nr:anthranilate synthase component I [Clostridia bacterium]